MICQRKPANQTSNCRISRVCEVSQPHVGSGESQLREISASFSPKTEVIVITDIEARSRYQTSNSWKCLSPNHSSFSSVLDLKSAAWAQFRHSGFSKVSACLSGAFVNMKASSTADGEKWSLSLFLHRSC